MSFLVRCMLFISSYFPLTLIFWILFVTRQPLWAWGSLIVGIVGVIVTYIYFLLFLPTVSPIQAKIETQQVRDGDVMSYIASYVVPFITFPLDGWQQLAALAVFIFVLGCVYINSDMIRINPMLNIIGYHLYEITLESSPETYALITRRKRMKRGQTIRIVDVSSGSRIYLERFP